MNNKILQQNLQNERAEKPVLCCIFMLVCIIQYIMIF